MPDSFSELVQVHLNHGCYRDNYHGDSGMIKDLQAPWDPGKIFVIAAWGQAAFQEGRDVRSLLCTWVCNLRPLHGSAHLLTTIHYKKRHIRDILGRMKFFCHTYDTSMTIIVTKPGIIIDVVGSYFYDKKS